MSFTPDQQAAIVARGNVLMVAGAGTGKTTTLVQRCLHCLLEEKPPVTMEEILMVTFTDASAVDMRRRIREALETEIEKLKQSDQEAAERLQEQLALFDTAQIGTLHSFCLQLVRQHFYELELDPQLAVMPEEEAKLLADETLGEIFEAHYAGKTPNAEAVQQLIQTQARGWDLPIRALVLKLHHYTQTLRDPEGWFASQCAMFHSAEAAQWQTWLREGVFDWRNRWLPVLQSQPSENQKAVECAGILKNLPVKPSREQCAAVLHQILLADADWPKGKSTAWRKPIEDLFDEATFLYSLARTDTQTDPLAQDWNWVRPQMGTLLELAREFTVRFSEKKRELGAVDFHDLEQHALRLLWDRSTKKPTTTALQWRRKLRFVFVDEYQDINEAQDAIFKALSREDDEANRFLVGDVKQSIYRFRLADPRIFQHYADTWRGEFGRVIPLVDNFRSRESILSFVNSLFSALMRREIGSVPYGEDARLRFGDPENRHPLSVVHDAAPRVELHLRLKGAGDPTHANGETESAGLTEVMNLEEAAKEARLTALRLREMKMSDHLVWDEEAKRMRPVEWGDMAVLLRSPSGKAESYAREFTRLGVPLTVVRGGFYESLEITDLLSLLETLDNPLQDLPVLAVLHSPLVGMSLDELAAIRLTLPKVPFWTALQRYHETNVKHSGWPKADRFLKNFAAWRRLARQVSLSGCLQAVLDETHYAAWLLTQPRGEQRHANVQRLLALALQFDQFQRQGLFRFLDFIEAQKAAETEPQVAAVSGENSVALMSIHQSKGLEFPVVVVADLGKPFNSSDLNAEIILDSEFGLCPQVKPPHTGQRYPSLPYFLARQRQKNELLGEEMRLLYVAMTRARDTLILTGTLAEKKFDKQWREISVTTTASLLAARSYLDWLAAWSAQTAETQLTRTIGENNFWRWTIYDELDKRLLEEVGCETPAPHSEESRADLDPASYKKLREHLEWRYPYLPATHEPAKTSVTLLRKRSAEEADSEAKPLFKFTIRNPQSAIHNSVGRLSATEVGTVHHTFLQFVSLEQAGTLAGLQAEARRLELEGTLPLEQIAHLDFAALAEFWQSVAGKEIRAHAKNVRRELAFTARFSPVELPGDLARKLDDGEFVVVQGAADLAVILPDELWLVDFKTDQLTATELPEKVKLYEPQLRLYALALGRIYRRPVTRAALHFLTLRRSVSLADEDER
jgi:ATP-dependent helicase/nuclease subunit A